MVRISLKKKWTLKMTSKWVVGDAIEKWSIEKNVPAYSNISKRYLLFLCEKLAIITSKDQDNFLNKRSKVMNKCRHENKFLLSNNKSNDWFYLSREHNIIWRFLYCNGFILLQHYLPEDCMCKQYMKLWVVNYCYTFS